MNYFQFTCLEEIHSIEFNFQALFYWLRSYLLEWHDVVSKSEANRMAIAQQRMQLGVSGTISDSIGLVGDGNARVQVHAGVALSLENQVHKATQSSGEIDSRDGRTTHVQEPERSTGVDSRLHAGNNQPINDGAQNALRSNGPLGFAASAASAFDAAKDIMMALRSKHANLADELEVIVTYKISFNIKGIYVCVHVRQSKFLHICELYTHLHIYVFIFLKSFRCLSYHIYSTLFNVRNMFKRLKDLFFLLVS